jgi:transcriptional regulatory protein RtcR
LERFRLRWAGVPEDVLEGVVSEEVRAGLDRFDRVQLEEVLRVCRGTRSLSEAGRVLFAVSREKKASSNDADRLKKYLGRFGVDFETAKGAEAQRAQRG